ncbi:MAG: response regulator [Candidatus Omnitrophica bacterium]|nr:response regulator [Candidatus Omnitrophota bacterium]
MEKSILVIDDDRMVTYALTHLLAKEGYSATTSQDGDEALDEVFRQERFDLIICDLRLPGINGIEVVKRIKQHLKSRNESDVPVIFITGYTDTDLHIKAQELGRVVYKPFDNKDLLESISEYI